MGFFCFQFKICGYIFQVFRLGVEDLDITVEEWDCEGILLSGLRGRKLGVLGFRLWTLRIKSVDLQWPVWDFHDPTHAACRNTN